MGRSIAFMVVAASSLSFAEWARGSQEVEVWPPHSTVEGKSIGEWGAVWWQWALSIPADVSPLTDPTGSLCTHAQAWPVVFIPGTFGTDVVRHSCVVPAGKNILIPLLNGACYDDKQLFGRTCAELHQSAAILGQTSVLELSVDGVAVPDLFDHLEEFDPCFSLYIPENSVNEVSRGFYEPVATAGFLVMLKPLPPGDHTIHIHAVLGDPLAPIFELHVSYEDLKVAEGLSLPPTFQRGDVNGDAAQNLTDAIVVLGFMFLGNPTSLSCEDAADVDDDGALNLTDVIYLLTTLFLGGDAPPPPSWLWPGSTSACGIDPSKDSLPPCESRC